MSGGPNSEKWSPASGPSTAGSGGGGGGGNGVLLNRTVSQGSTSSGRPYQERCVDPPYTPTTKTPTTTTNKGGVHKADPRDANGKQAEIQDFLAVPSESYAGGGGTSCAVCTPCASLAACRTFVCTVLTCGLYRACRRLPCLSPAAQGPSPQEAKKDPRSAPSFSFSSSSQAPEREDSESGYTDIYLRGVKVESIFLDDEEETVAYRPPLQEQPRPFDLHKCGSVYLEELDDEWSRTGSGDVDELISRKLLELYSQVQIDELAKCTSDSFFLKRTSEISRLISDIVTETQMEEKDAECRLVHGIIRLSTRKSKKRPPVQVRRHTETPADSGTETMKGSFSLTDSNYNDLDVQISKETSSDIVARQMRHGSDRANSSSSPTTFSPAYRETDTDSSGLPLLHRYPRT